MEKIARLPILRTDVEGRIRSLNDFGQAFFGCSNEQIAGRKIPGTILPDTPSSHRRVQSLLRAVADRPHEHASAEWKHAAKAGRQRWVLWTAQAIPDGRGRASEILFIGSDITDQKRAQRELSAANAEMADINSQLERAIEQANRLAFSAEASNVAKSQFLANISHEIRTPLNGIMGMTELVLDTELTDEQREYLNIVKSSADSLLALINETLDLSKIEAEKLDLNPLPFNLRDQLGETLKTLAIRAQQKGLELLCHVAPEVPDALLGDALRLKQILINLLGNAVKFTDRGEVLLRVEATAKTESQLWLRFAVMDTGVGVPPHRQRLIFEPFIQAEGSTGKALEGTGLGLAISSQLVTRMGGQIWVESPSPLSRGSGCPGSAFYFNLPFEIDKTAAAPDPTHELSRLKGLRVLVVDDSQTSRDILEEMLVACHMFPTVVDGGPEALKLMERTRGEGGAFDVVLVDEDMPGMTGTELLEKLAKGREFARSKVHMTTSGSSRFEEKAPLPSLADARLKKPVMSWTLREAILEALDAAAGRGRSKPQHESAAQRAGKDGPEAPSGLRILLADDNDINQMMMRRMLEKHGHRVTVVGDGKAAMEALERVSFDLALMDLQMPGMHGFEVTAFIRALEREQGGHLPIIALTAHALKGDRERCLEAGMDGYVSKPVRLDALLEEMGEVIGKNGGPRRTSPEKSARNAGKSDARPAEVYDREELMARLDGDLDLLREVSDLFLKSAPVALKEIRRAILDGDAPLLQRAAHAMKGTLGSLSARAAYATACRLEEMAAGGDLTEARDTVCILEDQVSLLQRELESAAEGGVP